MCNFAQFGRKPAFRVQGSTSSWLWTIVAYPGGSYCLTFHASVTKVIKASSTEQVHIAPRGGGVGSGTLQQIVQKGSGWAPLLP